MSSKQATTKKKHRRLFQGQNRTYCTHSPNSYAPNLPSTHTVFRTQQQNYEYSFRYRVGNTRTMRVHSRSECYVPSLHFTLHPGADYSVSTWELCAKYTAHTTRRDMVTRSTHLPVAAIRQSHQATLQAKYLL